MNNEEFIGRSLALTIVARSINEFCFEVKEGTVQELAEIVLKHALSVGINSPARFTELLELTARVLLMGPDIGSKWIVTELAKLREAQAEMEPGVVGVMAEVKVNSAGGIA